MRPIDFMHHLPVFPGVKILLVQSPVANGENISFGLYLSAFEVYPRQRRRLSLKSFYARHITYGTKGFPDAISVRSSVEPFPSNFGFLSLRESHSVLRLTLNWHLFTLILHLQFLAIGISLNKAYPVWAKPPWKGFYPFMLTRVCKEVDLNNDVEKGLIWFCIFRLVVDLILWP